MYICVVYLEVVHGLNSMYVLTLYSYWNAWTLLSLKNLGIVKYSITLQVLL